MNTNTLMALRASAYCSRCKAYAALICMAALTFMWTHMGRQCVFVLPVSTPRARHSVGRHSLAATPTTGQMMKHDLVANAVAAAAFNLWADEHPATANFMGRHASRQHIAYRVKLLQAALGLDWAQVFGLVRADSRVLFVSSAKHVQQAFDVLEKELGGRDAALQIVMNQPTILLADTSKIQGKGDWLRTMALLSKVSQPFYREIRKSAIFPKPLGWDFGLP